MIKNLKKITIILILSAGIFLLIYVFTNNKQPLTLQMIMKLTSPAFMHESSIPPKFTCDADNINPLLNISQVPEKANSIVLVVDDPDAPAGTWTHWTLWNIDPKITSIAENSVPQGAVEGATSFGRTGWGGPCPHSGTHRYFFKLYALDNMLDLNPDADASRLTKEMEGHILDQATLIGTYIRQ